MALEVGVLLDAIDANIGVAVGSSPENSHAIDNLYEAFLFGLVLAAARDLEPTSVGWTNLTGPLSNEVRLRAGPGEIYSPKFSFATLSFDGVPVFELHQGIRVTGSSGVAHECDLALLHAGRAAWRRSRRQRPRGADLFFAVEAKAYEATRVDLALARGFVGLRSDLQEHKMALITAIEVDQSADRLIDSWTVGAFSNVMPGSKESAAILELFAAVLQA